MKRLYIIILIIILGWSRLFSQVGINTDGSQADPTAIFDIKSSTKGFLLPRMTADERNSIINPAEGLMVFCTNCGLNGTGVLCLYTDGDWFTFSICKTSAPTAGVNEMPPSTIIWHWNAVSGATGYKWNTTNSFDGAIDMGAATSKVETGVFCDTTYTRYVWAYDGCGPSEPAVLTQLTTNCWVCGADMMVNHDSGDVAPENKTATYGTVSYLTGDAIYKCWITRNLGASQQATARNDNTEASAGWYWQFNRKQGYKYEGTNRTPNTTWITEISEYLVWTAANDPCTIELGLGWRIPTIDEWNFVDTNGGWVSWTGPYNSALNIHAAGQIEYYNGILADRGSKGLYWSTTQTGTITLAQNLSLNTSFCITTQTQKANGFPVRCVKD